eukprot:2544577-Amphidinium_carterae.2
MAQYLVTQADHPAMVVGDLLASSCFVLSKRTGAATNGKMRFAAPRQTKLAMGTAFWSKDSTVAKPYALRQSGAATSSGNTTKKLPTILTFSHTHIGSKATGAQTLKSLFQTTHKASLSVLLMGRQLVLL